jgi:arylsulfatase A-like enzyme
VEYVLAVYDEEIAFTDRWIGRLLAKIDEATKRPTIVALTADHGEYFLERGRFGHGKDVHEPLVRVPLIVAGAIDPGIRGTRVPFPVGTNHLGRTLLTAAGIESTTLTGVDLLALAAGQGTPPPALTEGSYAWGADQRKLALIDGNYKLILNRDDGRFELYQLGVDPAEQVNLYGVEAYAAEQARLEAELVAGLVRGVGGGGTVELTDDETETLRSLGYIQ